MASYDLWKEGREGGRKGEREGGRKAGGEQRWDKGMHMHYSYGKSSYKVIPCTQEVCVNQISLHKSISISVVCLLPSPLSLPLLWGGVIYTPNEDWEKLCAAHYIHVYIQSTLILTLHSCRLQVIQTGSQERHGNEATSACVYSDNCGITIA